MGRGLRCASGAGRTLETGTLDEKELEQAQGDCRPASIGGGDSVFDRMDSRASDGRVNNALDTPIVILLNGLRGYCHRMTEMNPWDRDPSILKFYAIDERPVAIDRLSQVAWAWDEGSWTSDPSLAPISDTQGVQLSQDDFVHRFPHAALALLDSQLKGVG